MTGRGRASMQRMWGAGAPRQGRPRWMDPPADMPCRCMGMSDEECPCKRWAKRDTPQAAATDVGCPCANCPCHQSPEPAEAAEEKPTELEMGEEKRFTSDA